MIKSARPNHCAICQERTIRLVGDHDHKTNKKRGLICNNCNLGLGLFKDNIDSLIAAVIYLQMFKETPEHKKADWVGVPYEVRLRRLAVGKAAKTLGVDLEVLKNALQAAENKGDMTLTT